MATDTIARADRRPAEFGALFRFHEVFQKEIALINQRRARDPRGEIQLQIEALEDISGEPVFSPPEEANVVGLALSGGGIRSSAFCLGVLQALHVTSVLDRVDYLSTVSGGGYVGCSLTAALEWTGRMGNAPEFPFISRLMEDETPSLQHIRDHSNYLFPRGASDVLHNASIYARGLVVNAVLLAPFLLGASAITLLAYAAASSKIAKLSGFGFLNPFGLRHFVLTADLALLLITAGIAWGILQSRAPTGTGNPGQPDALGGRVGDHNPGLRVLRGAAIRARCVGSNIADIGHPGRAREDQWGFGAAGASRRSHCVFSE